MRRLILYAAGFTMIVGGVVLGCAHNRCGDGGCNASGGSYVPQGGPTVPDGSATGTSPSHHPPLQPQPRFAPPSGGSGRPGGGFGGSGVR